MGFNKLHSYLLKLYLLKQSLLCYLIWFLKVIYVLLWIFIYFIDKQDKDTNNFFASKIASLNLDRYAYELVHSLM